MLHCTVTIRITKWRCATIVNHFIVKYYQWVKRSLPMRTCYISSLSCSQWTKCGNLSTSVSYNSSNESLFLTTNLKLPTSLLFEGTFYLIVPDKCSDKKIVILCTKCPTQEQTGVRGNDKTTSNFVGHLKRKHDSSIVEE